MLAVRTTPAHSLATQVMVATPTLTSRRKPILPSRRNAASLRTSAPKASTMLATGAKVSAVVVVSAAMIVVKSGNTRAVTNVAARGPTGTLATDEA